MPLSIWDQRKQSSAAFFPHSIVPPHPPFMHTHTIILVIFSFK